MDIGLILIKVEQSGCGSLRLPVSNQGEAQDGKERKLNDETDPNSWYDWSSYSLFLKFILFDNGFEFNSELKSGNR